MAGRFRFNSRAPLQASNTRHFILEELFDTIYSMLRYKIPVEHKPNSHFPPKFLSFPFNTTTFEHPVGEFQKSSGISAHLRNVEHTTYRVPANRLKSSVLPPLVIIVALTPRSRRAAAATLNLPRGNSEGSVVRVAGAGQHFSSDNKPPEANASLDLQGDACETNPRLRIRFNVCECPRNSHSHSFACYIKYVLKTRVFCGFEARSRPRRHCTIPATSHSTNSIPRSSYPDWVCAPNRRVKSTSPADSTQAHPRKLASGCSRRQLVHGVNQPSRRVPTGTVSNYGAPECAAARSPWREVRAEWDRSAVWRYWRGREGGRIAGGVGGTRLDAGTALLRNSQLRLERPTTRLGSHAVLQLVARGLRTQVSRQTDVGLASLWCEHEDDIALAA
ncbi:hypothetical protein C8R43DRAFT_1229225 [Mycena crocata]|nr:hypothetical protein C8R43DRAFT_1229225 [Mycena crocata]